MVEDVRGIGKAIGVKFNGDKANIFNVLSHRGGGGWGVVERVRSGREIRRKRETRGSREGHGEGVKSVGGS